MKQTNYCILEPGFGNIKVKFSVSRNIAAGASFVIYGEDKKTVVTEWKVSIENDSYDLKFLNMPVEKLNKCYLAWQVIFCSNNENFTRGNIEIEILKDEEICKIIGENCWKFEGIPSCKSNQTSNCNGSLVFIIRK